MKPPEEIVLPLDTIDQLVELLPASPFIKRRLTEDAEKFIIERASALPRARTFKLIVCVPESDAVERQRVTEAVHQHFIFRREEAEKELSRVRQMGWRSLLIGLVFLSVTILVVELIKRYLPAGNLSSVAQNGLAILAWVALWRPGELLLYEWYPFRRDGQLFSKLERAEMEFIPSEKKG